MKQSVIDSHIGEKHNYLTIERFDHKGKNNQYYYLCSCKCGNKKVVRYTHLTGGGVQSCGCILKESRSKKHGLWSFNKRLYKSWHTMIYRCENPKSTHYKVYGGRGISVCKEWHNPEEFMKWALENGYNDNLTIDRIDVNGNYEPSNCRWITQLEQARNKRNNKKLKINGVEKCVTEWESIFGRSAETAKDRMSKGMTIEKAFSYNGNIGKNPITINGVTKSKKEWCKEYHISHKSVDYRIKHNKMDIVSAITMPKRRMNGTFY